MMDYEETFYILYIHIDWSFHVFLIIFRIVLTKILYIKQFLLWYLYNAQFDTFFFCSRVGESMRNKLRIYLPYAEIIGKNAVSMYSKFHFYESKFYMKLILVHYFSPHSSRISYLLWFANIKASILTFLHFNFFIQPSLLWAFSISFTNHIYSFCQTFLIHPLDMSKPWEEISLCINCNLEIEL